MGDEVRRLVFRAPGREAPGFLRRARRALEFRERMSRVGEPTVGDLDEMVAFLGDYVVGLTGEEAREALLDASEEQFFQMLGALIGEGGGQAEADPTRGRG